MTGAPEESTAITLMKTVQISASVDDRIAEMEDRLDATITDIEDVAKLGRKAVSDLSQLSTSANNPKVYESLAILIKAVNDSHRIAGELIARRHEMVQRGQIDSPPVQNNLYVTPTEMMERLIQRRRDSEDGAQ